MKSGLSTVAGGIVLLLWAMVGVCSAVGEQKHNHTIYGIQTEFLRGGNRFSGDRNHERRRQLAAEATVYYSTAADFEKGDSINLQVFQDQLQLSDVPKAFRFVWVPKSGTGTIVKIDADTGQILGEYRTAPEGRSLNPSRTTVDVNGNVWAGNRDERGEIEGIIYGSVVKIGLEENGECVDRNNDTEIQTSRRKSDGEITVLPWPDISDGAGSTDNSGHGAQVQDAEDECILIYQRTPEAYNIRHVSVDTDNNVWVGGYTSSDSSDSTSNGFTKLNSIDGSVLSNFSAAAIGCGGYGGLVDENEILWSADYSNNKLLRYDTSTGNGVCLNVRGSYGMAIDREGNIWNSNFDYTGVTKIAPDGTILESEIPTKAGRLVRGVAVTEDGDVWVADSSSIVTRLYNNGTVRAQITVGTTPTGLSVDQNEKVWVSNRGSNNVVRIDPATNTVDNTTDLGTGAEPYTYGDMTGSTNTALPQSGTWTVVHVSETFGQEWGFIEWNESTPADSAITVYVRTSVDGVSFTPRIIVNNGADFIVADGQYIQIIVEFRRGSNDESPILYDLLVANEAPSEAPSRGPSESPTEMPSKAPSNMPSSSFHLSEQPAASPHRVTKAPSTASSTKTKQPSALPAGFRTKGKGILYLMYQRTGRKRVSYLKYRAQSRYGTRKGRKSSRKRSSKGKSRIKRTKRVKGIKRREGPRRKRKGVNKIVKRGKVV